MLDVLRTVHGDKRVPNKSCNERAAPDTIEIDRNDRSVLLEANVSGDGHYLYSNGGCMSFSDDFGKCVENNLPSELIDLLTDPEIALNFVYELIGGASVEEALVAVGIGAEAAAAAAAAVATAGIAVAVIVSTVLSACVASAASSTIWDAIQSLGSSVWDVLKNPLADAGYSAPSSTAAA